MQFSGSPLYSTLIFSIRFTKASCLFFSSSNKTFLFFLTSLLVRVLLLLVHRPEKIMPKHISFRTPSFIIPLFSLEKIYKRVHIMRGSRGGGGRGSGPPEKSESYRVPCSNTGLNPLKSHKATNVRQSLASQGNAIHWLSEHGMLLVVLGSL